MVGIVPILVAILVGTTVLAVVAGLVLAAGEDPDRKRGGLSFLALGLILCGLLVTLKFWQDSQTQAHHLEVCRANLKSLVLACEMYRLEHKGSLPGELSQLVPSPLKAIPKCPSAGLDTYSSGYKLSRSGSDFFVCCHGRHHLSAGEDKPDFNSAFSE